MSCALHEKSLEMIFYPTTPVHNMHRKYTGKTPQLHDEASNLLRRCGANSTRDIFVPFVFDTSYSSKKHFSTLEERCVLEEVLSDAGNNFTFNANHTLLYSDGTYRV